MGSLVSVLLPVRNGEPYIGAALESILRQDVDLELVVIDNNSHDATRHIVESYDDSRLKLMSCSIPGIVPTLNHGLGAASGVFIARMDADDISAESRLKQQVDRLQGDPGLQAVGTWYSIFEDSYEHPRAVKRPPDDDPSLRRRLLTGNPFAHGSMMFRGTAVSYYRDQFAFAEDYDLIRRIAQIGRLGVVPEVLYHWRRHKSSTATGDRACYRKVVRDELWTKGALVDDPRALGGVKWPISTRGAARIWRWNALLVCEAVRRGEYARLRHLLGRGQRGTT